MKYKCLVLDHDDTVVNSTYEVHYPSFMGYLKQVRPNFTITFEEYMYENFHPGFQAFCTDTLKFSEKEMEEEVEYWRTYVREHIPTAYKGFKKILQKFKKENGIICVVSHSLSENILRDYNANELPTPDDVYGWEKPASERKPSPYPIFEIMSKYELNPFEILMVDDLKPGLDMARDAGIDFAAAAWAYELPTIQSYMKKHSDYYLETVKELENVIFG